MAADFTVVFALYPRLTQLDFTGPYEVFWRLPRAEDRKSTRLNSSH